MSSCPACGRAISARARQCPHCGDHLGYGLAGADPIPNCCGCICLVVLLLLALSFIGGLMGR
jgi:hypothetical protein